MAKVAVVCHQRHLVVDTGLGDQYVRQFRLMTVADETSSKQPRAAPVAFHNLEHRQERNVLDQFGRRRGVAQKFTNDDRRENPAAMGHRIPHEVDIMAGVTREEPPE